MILRWDQPAPPVALAWIGPDQSVRAAAAYLPPRPIAAIIGPAGASGAEANRFTFTQASALTPWVVNHNLGVFPSAVCVKTPGGMEVNAEVLHVSVNQCIITFAIPFAGVAIIN